MGCPGTSSLSSGWSIGIRVASALVQAGQRVVIVERDRENRFLSEAKDLRVPVIFGDATQR